jgi:hypothetical protein
MLQGLVGNNVVLTQVVKKFSAFMDTVKMATGCSYETLVRHPPAECSTITLQ